MIWQRQATGCYRRALRSTAGVCAIVACGVAAAQSEPFDPTRADLPRMRLSATAISASTRGPVPVLSLPDVDRSLRVRPVTRGFYADFFLPRMTTQFDRMRAYGDVPSSGQALTEFVLLDEVTGAAQKRAERGLSRSLRNYVLETTTIGRWIESFGDDAVRAAGVGGGGESSGRLRTGFGIAHGRPRVDLRYPIGDTMLRLGIGGDRTMGFEVRGGRATAAAVSAKYDWGEHEYTLGCRIAF